MLSTINSLFANIFSRQATEKADEKVDLYNDEKSSSNEGKILSNLQPRNRIILMLDESGSMDIQKTNAVKAVNSFLTKQKEESPGDVCLFDLITFNDDWKRIVTNTQIEEVKEIQLSSYNPNGGTALYDGIWEVIDAHTKESEVMLVIMTDGQDTTSSHHTQAQLRDRLIGLNKERDWQIVWLGADAMVAREGLQSGASAVSQVDFDHLPQYLSSTLSEGVSAYRKNKNAKIRL
jgi:Mg-chelatase subunit ChlD